MTSTTPKVWFITGASRGFGRVWTEAALERGDKVAATARNVEALADLVAKYGSNVLTIQLDVTNEEQVRAAIDTAHAHFGRLDVVMNNAGYSLIATIEEASAEEVRALYETNIIGPTSVIKAALPKLRAQGAGHIVGISSGLGHFTIPFIGYYCSSKWAFEAIHECLAAEIKPFGINVTIVEPGAYATEFGSPESRKQACEMEVYNDLRKHVFHGLQSIKRGDPKATPNAIFAIVDSPNPPLRLFLGSQNLPRTREAYAARIALWEEWADVADAAQGN